MAITLKDESILNEWATLIDGAAGHSQGVLTEIEDRLEDAKIPGGCDWSVEEVKSSGFFAKVRRDFLVVTLEQFRDYHMYIGIRDYGKHLDCVRFLTVEPGFMKKWASEKLTGYVDALSAPKNILVHQDLKSWSSVVHHAVLDSVESLVKRLGKNPALIERGSKGILEIW